MSEFGDDIIRQVQDAVDGVIDEDLAEMEIDFNRLAASLVSRPEDEIRDALTRFWADNLDSLDEDVTDWIEDDTSALANGELVTLDVKRLS
ncbi:MAG: hypothetical protein WD473_02325 [Acidimicrobiia bacterium]